MFQRTCRLRPRPKPYWNETGRPRKNDVTAKSVCSQVFSCRVRASFECSRFHRRWGCTQQYKALQNHLFQDVYHWVYVPSQHWISLERCRNYASMSCANRFPPRDDNTTWKRLQEFSAKRLTSNETTPNESQNAGTKKSMALLEKELENAVATYLEQRYPNVFLRPSSWQHQEKGHVSTEQRMEILATLNGYVPIPIPSISKVPLAEGVIAKPRWSSSSRSLFSSNQNVSSYRLFSRPVSKFASTNTMTNGVPRPKNAPKDSSKRGGLPPMVEPDITIYRALENLVEQRLEAWYKSLLELRSLRIAGSLPRRHEKTEEVHPHGPVRDTSTVGQSNEAVSTIANDDEEQEQEEDLLIVETHTQASFTTTSVTMVTNMLPSHRLLAFPASEYRLEHKGASTLISISLVVFGAIPLAYRSFQFAISMPVVAEVVAASVVGTISYGIWASRDGAWTRQSRIVATALNPRIYARDDAVDRMLTHSAIQMVAKRVLDVYHRYESTTNKIERNKYPENDLINPMEIALTLGLIQKKPDQASIDDKEMSCDEFIAVPFDTACDNLVHAFPNKSEE